MEAIRIGTFTAQVLVGRAHPNDGGINGITHSLYLSESSRPAWVLQANGGVGKRKITWIPTIEHMLEDVIVMVGLYILKDEELIRLYNKYFSGENKNFICLYDDFTDEQRAELYHRCEQITTRCKLIISAFSGSTIERQLGVLKKFDWDIEACRSIYQKEFSVWSNKRIEKGSLDMPRL